MRRTARGRRRRRRRLGFRCLGRRRLGCGRRGRRRGLRLGWRGRALGSSRGGRRMLRSRRRRCWRRRTGGRRGVGGRRSRRRGALRGRPGAMPATLGRRAGRPATRPLTTVLARTRTLAPLRAIFRLAVSRGRLRHPDGGGRTARIVGLRRIRDPLAEGQRGGRQHDETQLAHDRFVLPESDARRVPSREPCDEPIEVRLQCGSRDTSIRVLRFLFFVARCVDAATFMAHSRHRRMRMTNLTVKPSRSSHTN